MCANLSLTPSAPSPPANPEEDEAKIRNLFEKH